MSAKFERHDGDQVFGTREGRDFLTPTLLRALYAQTPSDCISKEGRSPRFISAGALAQNPVTIYAMPAPTPRLPGILVVSVVFS
jgi:hypothetical protein